MSRFSTGARIAQLCAFSLAVLTLGMPAIRAESAGSTTTSAAMQEAQTCSDLGHNIQAIEIYSRILQSEPGNTDALLARAYARIRVRQLTAALSDVDAVLKSGRNQADAFALGALARWMSGDKSHAAQDIRKAQSLNAKSPRVAFVLGRVDEIENRIGRAVTKYDAALSIDPKYVPALVGRGRCLFEQKQYKAAKASLEKAVELSPSNTEAYEKLFQSEWGLWEQGDSNCLDKMMTDATKALALNPSSPEAHKYLAYGLRVKNKPQEALAEADAGLKSNPNYSSLYHIKGTILDDLKQHDKALAEFDKALAKHPDDAFNYQQRALSHENAEEFEAALKDIDMAIRLAPWYSGYKVNRGNILLDMKSFDEAIKTFSDAIAQDPDTSLAYTGRALCYQNKDESKLAEADLIKAIQLDPKDDWPHRCLSALYERNKDYAGALKEANVAISMRPNSDVCYARRGDIYMGMRQWPKALSDVQRAVQLGVRTGTKYAALAKCLKGAGRFEDGLNACNSAVSLDSRYLPDRACFYFAEAKFDKAIADYNQAISRFPQDQFNYLVRGAIEVCRGNYDKAVADEKKAIALFTWKSEQAQYGSLLGSIAYRSAGKSQEAEQMLQTALNHADKKKWPYPIVEYELGKISEKQLFALADDVNKNTEANFYTGMQQKLAGKEDEARNKFKWVYQNGNTDYIEWDLASAFLMCEK